MKKDVKWSYDGVKSLESVVVGAIKDYSYSKNIDKFFSENPDKVQYTYGEEPLVRNIQKLLGGRFNAIIEDMNVASYKFEQMGVEGKIISAGYAEDHGQLYIGFSPAKKASKEYARIFSEGMKEIKKNRRIRRDTKTVWSIILEVRE